MTDTETQNSEMAGVRSTATVRQYEVRWKAGAVMFVNCADEDEAKRCLLEELHQQGFDAALMDIAAVAV